MIHYFIVGILVLGSTYFLYTFVLTNENLLPFAASLQAGPIDTEFSIQWFFISFFLSLIIVFMLYSVVVFRRKKGEEGDGAYFEGNTTLEIVWTVIPLAIVLFLAYRGSQALGQIEMRASNELEVEVIASQWNWLFVYPDGTITNELALPKDRQVLLRMRSEDVIHSFWVPEFRVKQDILPGGEDKVQELRITPTELGNYRLRCAELCGQLHYAMLAEVVVLTESEFNGWLAEQAAGCDLDDALCGQKWATVNGCFACHSLDGEVIVGPSWQDLYGSQVTLADGSTVTADDDYLRSSILDPNAQLHEGFAEGVMPQNFDELLTDEQIDQIIVFIQSLQE